MGGAKNTAMVLVIGVCLAVAIGGTYLLHLSHAGRTKSGIESIPADETVLMMCEDPNCGHVFEMNKREYYYEMEKQPMVIELEEHKPPALLCERCGKETAYRAVRCAKCGKIFFRGTVANDFADRCPDPNCGYSRIEEMRRRAATQRGEVKGDGQSEE